MEDHKHSKWLWLVFVIPPAAAIITSLLAPDPHGHWTEHLTSVGLKSAQLILLVVLVTMLGWRKLGVLLLLSIAVVAIGIVYQVVGDYQVADSIWRTAGDPGRGIGYVGGHDTSAFGDLIVLVGGFAFAVIAGATRRVRAKFAVIGVVMLIIPPPFFWPAAGVLMLMVLGLTSGSRLRRPTPETK
ncbi:MAG: hypothetical protein ABIQ38_03740 [Ilumatobacteraceae bacterium]